MCIYLLYYPTHYSHSLEDKKQRKSKKLRKSAVMLRHMKKLYGGHKKDEDTDDSKMLKHMNKLHKKEEELDDNKMMQVIFLQ